MNHLNDLKNQRGFTLVEVLAAIVILSIVGVLIFNIISSGQKQYTKQSKNNQDWQDISYQLKVLTKDIREAKRVVSDDQHSFTIIKKEAPDDGVNEKIEYRYTPPDKTAGTSGKLKREDEPEFLTIENVENDEEKDDVFEFYVIDEHGDKNDDGSDKVILSSKAEYSACEPNCELEVTRIEITIKDISTKIIVRSVVK